MEVRVGTRVRSTAGRDKGVDFIVIAVEGEYLSLADGDLRKVDRPKRKKLKHVQASADYSEFIADKLAVTGKVTNAEVRKALAEINS